ncbi:MAG: hypothetical protein WDN04_22690 [Rhodospirillales bacterium]
MIATLAWGVLQAGDMADAGSVAQALEALPTVVGRHRVWAFDAGRGWRCCWLWRG